jgi:hypothetical protein
MVMDKFSISPMLGCKVLANVFSRGIILLALLTLNLRAKNVKKWRSMQQSSCTKDAISCKVVWLVENRYYKKLI